jgi:hypothetical protein
VGEAKMASRILESGFLVDFFYTLKFIFVGEMNGEGSDNTRVRDIRTQNISRKAYPQALNAASANVFDVTFI